MTYEERCLQYSYKIYMQELKMNQRQELAAQKAYAAYIKNIGRAELQQERQIYRNYEQYNRYLQKIANAQQREINKQEKQLQRQYEKQQAYIEKYDQTQFNMDVQKLLNLGFSMQAIQTAQAVHDRRIQFTTQKLREQGFNDVQVKTLMNIFKVCTGTMGTDTYGQLKSTLQKTTGRDIDVKRQLGLIAPTDLNAFASKLYNTDKGLGLGKYLISDTVDEVPKIAIVQDINVDPFKAWNFNSEPLKQSDLKKYIVTSDNNTTIDVLIPNKCNPQVPHNSKFVVRGNPNLLYQVKGIFEVPKNNQTTDGRTKVKFWKNYCRVANRYLIVASFTRPTRHCGCYYFLNCDGRSTMYVYIENHTTETIKGTKLRGANKRAYCWGICWDWDRITKMRQNEKNKKDIEEAYLKRLGFKENYNESNAEERKEAARKNIARNRFKLPEEMDTVFGTCESDEGQYAVGIMSVLDSIKVLTEMESRLLHVAKALFKGYAGAPNTLAYVSPTDKYEILEDPTVQKVDDYSDCIDF